jgi:hypothetical protein
MFPTYNPNVPLAQQSYYPQRPFPDRSSSLYSRNNVSRQEYRDSIATPIDRQLGHRTAPPSVINFNDTASIMATPVFSSQRELEKLWAASHGTEPNLLIKTFDLEMARYVEPSTIWSQLTASRTSEATFTFGTDPQFPFYTLKTFDTSEISVSKTNPVKRSQVHEIVMSSIEPPARRQAPNDGLIAFIFPKMAAMLALNQSAELAKAHHLAPTDKDELEASAIRRAAAQEACHLRWNARHNRYELEHPAVARQARDPNFLKSPVSDDNGSMMLKIHDPMMHITISSPTDDSSPTINIINPNKVNQAGTPQTSAGAGIRLSTIPQSDSDPSLSSPLASLDLNTQSLHIDADQILTVMPSLFSIDSIVCALFAVAIADETTNPVLGGLPIWTPRPKAPMSQYGGSVKSYNGSQYFATLAEREEAEGEAKEMAREFKKDLKDNKSRKISASPLSSIDEKDDAELQETDNRGRTWYGARRKRSRSRGKKSRTKKVVIGEFDLEKLGRYQAGQREGQELPAPVRWFMEVLVAMLRCVTWLLTTIVSIIVWVLVRLTRCVTSERF